MSGPWEKYQTQTSASEGPWTKYQKTAPTMDEAPQNAGQDLGAGYAAVSGFNSAVPFGNRITAGIGSVLAAPFDDKSIPELYDQMRQSQATTNENNPTANTIGTLAGIGTSLPIGVPAYQAANVAKLAPGASNLARLGNLAARSGINAAKAAPIGFAYGAGDAKEGEMLQGGLEGAATTAAFSAALPLAGAAASGLGNAIIPKIDDVTAKLAQRAQDFGIPLRVDQLSPTRARKTVQKVSQELPFSGQDAFETKQRTAFNQAVAKTIGADTLTPDGINANLDRINGVYKKAIDGKIIDAADLPQKLSNILDEAQGSVSDDIVKIVSKNVDDINANITDGLINGNKLSSVRTTLVNRLKTADPRARPFLVDAISTLDDHAGPQLGQEASDSLRQVRREWRNYKTVEPLLEKATSGEINPTELLSRVQASPYIKASRSSTGQDELVDLARIGKEFLPKAGGSDTFQKGLFTAGGLSTLGGVGTVGTIPTAVTAAGTLAGNRAYQSLYNSSSKVSKKIIDKAMQENPSEWKKILGLPPREAEKAFQRLIAIETSQQ